MTSRRYRILEQLIGKNGPKERLRITGEDRTAFLLEIGREQKTEIPYRLLMNKVEVRRTGIGRYPVLILSRPEGASGVGILYLYGGAFLDPPRDADYLLARDLAAETGCDVYFPLYPLVPDHRIHEAAAFVLEVMDRMCARYEDGKTGVLGFSSGACLALYAYMYRFHEGIAARYPQRLMLNSLIMRLPANEADRKRMEEMGERDVILPREFFREDGLSGWMAEREEERYRYLLDISAYDLSGLPETDLFMGTEELPSVSLEEIKEKFQREGIELHVHEGEGLMHCWGLYPGYPEGEETRQEYLRIVRSLENHPLK